MTEDYVNAVLKLSCATLCQSEGFDACNDLALDVLINLYRRQFMGLARTFLECCGGNVPKGDEICDVFNKMDISLVDLLKYFGKYKGISFPVSVPELPTRDSVLPLAVQPRLRADLVAAILTMAFASKGSHRTARTLTCVSMNESGHVLQEREGKLPESKRPLNTYRASQIQESYFVERNVLEGKMRCRAKKFGNFLSERSRQTNKKIGQPRRRSKSKPPIVLKLKIPRTIDELDVSKKYRRHLLENGKVGIKNDSKPGTSLVDNCTVFSGTPNFDLNIAALPAPPPKFQVKHQPLLVPGLIPTSTSVIPAFGPEFPFRFSPGLAPGLVPFSTPVVPKLTLPCASAETSKPWEATNTLSTGSLTVKKRRVNLNAKVRRGKEVLLTRIDDPLPGILSSHSSMNSEFQNPEITLPNSVWKIQIAESNKPDNQPETRISSLRIPKLILKRRFLNQHSKVSIPRPRRTVSHVKKYPRDALMSLPLRRSNFNKQSSPSGFLRNTEASISGVATSFEVGRNDRDSVDEEQTVNSEDWFCSECKISYISRMISCDKCQAWIHFSCAYISVTPDETDPWYCRRCLNRENSVEL